MDKSRGLALQSSARVGRTQGDGILNFLNGNFERKMMRIKDSWEKGRLGQYMIIFNIKISLWETQSMMPGAYQSGFSWKSRATMRVMGRRALL